MATSLSTTGCVGSSFYGSWGSSILGEDYTLLAKSVPSQVRVGRGKPVRLQPMMKNVNEGKGIFAPLVVVTRNIVGKKRFNQLRGKAIALHSQVKFDVLFKNCCLLWSPFCLIWWFCLWGGGNFWTWDHDSCWVISSCGSGLVCCLCGMSLFPSIGLKDLKPVEKEV